MCFPEKVPIPHQIWAVTPGMSAEKARSMLLEEDGKEKDSERQTLEFIARTGSGAGGKPGTPPCGQCGMLHSSICYQVYPDKAPEWWKGCECQPKWAGQTKARCCGCWNCIQYIKKQILRLCMRLCNKTFERRNSHIPFSMLQDRMAICKRFGTVYSNIWMPYIMIC